MMTDTDALHQPGTPPIASWSYRRCAGPGGHWVWLSVALYVAACFLPAMPAIFSDHKIIGLSCLASWMYTLPAWWANPAYFQALFLYACHRRRAATVFAVISAVLACSFEFLDFPNAGWYEGVFKQEVGCYVWIASMQVLACNLLWQEWIKWRERELELAAESSDCPTVGL